MSRLLTDKMKNCDHTQDDIWPDGSCPHCGWNRWIQYFETQEEVDQFEYEKKLSSKDKKDLVKEYLDLERQLVEVQKENTQLKEMREHLKWKDETRKEKERLERQLEEAREVLGSCLAQGDWDEGMEKLIEDQLKEQG